MRGFSFDGSGALPNPHALLMKSSRTLLLLGLAFMAARSEAAIISGLVGYWGFEGNGDNTAPASGGTTFNATLVNGATAGGTGKAGQGLQLNGTNQYATIGNNVDVNQAWTLSAWFRSDVNPTGRGMVYESFATTTTGYAMSFGIREGSPAGTKTAFELFADGVAADKSQQVQIDDTATADVWHHILTTYDPTTRQVTGYLDGSTTANFTLTLNAGDTLVNAPNLRLGTYRTADGRYFDGTIDEVALWNRGLDSAERAEVHALGFAGSPVPEPSAALFCGLGLLASLRRRR